MPAYSLTPAEAKSRLASNDFLLLDCREPSELSVARVTGSTKIPMMEIPRRLDELDRTKEIAVMCHHGQRSEQVAAYLSHLGYPRVASVAGGIDAWAAQLDPRMKRY